MSKGETTRELIIVKAAELFNKYGYNGCSLSTIMEATGLKKGGIYNHFKDKDEIAYAALEYSFNKVKQRYREELAKVKTVKEKLIAAMNVFASHYYNPVIEGECPIFNAAMDSSDTHPKLKEKAVVAINILQTYIAIKITEGIETGVFSKNTDPEKMAALMVCSLEGAVVMARMNNDPKYVEVTTDYIKDLIEQSALN